ncbi:MAG: amino acid permease [Pedobacter sp.]|nr:amino acid permease [Pedobacter sp.]
MSTSAAGAPGKSYIGVFALAMISVAAVLSLRNYPTMAVYGWSSIAWYLIGTLLFIIPLSLAAAELASGWPEDGGVYVWVKEAFGERWGFVAVWCAFSQNLIWYPTVLSYIAVSFASAIDPSLGANKLYNFVVMLGIFWGTILINLRGTQMTSKLSSVGVIVGTLIPGAFIIILWLVWMGLGKHNAIPFSTAALIPDLSLGNLPFVASMVLMFAGIEMCGYYAKDVKNPQKDFPKATFLAAIIIFIMSVVPTLALAWVVPSKEIDLNAGVIQALGVMFDGLNLHWMSPIMAIMLGVGGVALMTAWMVSPALGLGVVAKDGLLPPMWSHYNKQGIPVGVMMLQGVIGSLFTIAYISIPSVNTAYWIMSAMTTEVLVIMYILIFGAVIKLRYSNPDKPRPYRIPGGTAGVWIIGGTGLVALLLAGYFGMLPPSGMDFTTPTIYVTIMILGTVALAFTPFLFLLFRKDSWKEKAQKNQEKHA